MYDYYISLGVFPSCTIRRLINALLPNSSQKAYDTFSKSVLLRGDGGIWSVSAASAFSVLLSTLPSNVFGANLAIQHQDTSAFAVETSLPTVSGASWSIFSSLHFTETPDPHSVAVGGVRKFKSINIFSSSADFGLFTPLIVPGDFQGPTEPDVGHNLDGAGVFKVDWLIDGPGIFDFTDRWVLRVEDNRAFGDLEIKFGGGLAVEKTVGSGTVGGSLDFTYKPLTTPKTTLFETNHLATAYELLLSPTDQCIFDCSQGFFADGGRIVLEGYVKATAFGDVTLTYDNNHYGTGQGALVNDFTRALEPGSVRNAVFDQLVVVPIPPASWLFGTALVALAWAAKKGRKT